MDGVPVNGIGNPEYDNGDETVLESSAVWPYEDGFARFKVTTDAKHEELINVFKDELIQFLEGTLSASNTVVSSVNRKGISSTTETSLNNIFSFSINGRVQPYIVDPNGEGSSINPASGVGENNIPNAKTFIDVDTGGISMNNPLDGTYTVSVKGMYDEDYRLTIGYMEGEEIKLLDYTGFNHANTTSFTFTIDSTSDEDRLTIHHTPLPPIKLQANAVDAGGLKTKLMWEGGGDPDVTGYNIYSREEDEPYLKQIGNTTEIYYNADHPWAENSSIKTRIYAVSAVKADGTESFLSDMVENNDRDHDGLKDEQGTTLGTDVNKADTDGDGLNDGEEHVYGADPLLTDTDNDGYSDYSEIRNGSDPLDKDSVPPPLQAFYTFDEGSGTVAHDSASSNDGTINGATWTTGKSGGALSFDGNDYVQIPGLLGQPQNITISAWAQLNDKDTSGAEVLHGWAPIPGGYTIELAIPWSNLGIIPTAGMTLGFSVGYNDDDNGAGRDGQAVWIGTENNWLDTSAFGDITLGEASTPTPTPTITPTPTYTPTSTPTPTPSPTPIVTPTLTPIPTPLASGLEAHYTLDEGSGANANDSSGNGNHGAISGATWTAGKSGWALSLDGIDDNVQIPGLIGQSQNITISAWAQLNAKDTLGAEVISLGDHVAIRLDGSNGAKGFYYDGTTWRATATGLSYAGTGWHHFVYVVDDANNIQKVYVDGVEKGSTAYTQYVSYAGLGSNTFVGRHGNGGGNYDFNGIIDDVRVYNNALSVQEVLDLYNQSSSGLVSRWKFDEGLGTNATDSIDSNNGTITGAAWATGIGGWALNFDGNDYIQIPGLLGQPQNISLSAWVQLNAKDTSGAEVISLGDHVAIRLDGTGGAKGFYYDGAMWRATATGLSYAGTGWHHLVYVVDDTNNIQKVYVDGIEKGSTAYTQSISYAGLGSNTFIGRHGNGGGNYDFSGIIDDVCVYNKALKAQEVLDLYSQTSGLVNNWKFDEGIGTIANDWVDGNNGTINGAIWTGGKSGSALSFDGNDYVQISGLLEQPQNITISAWAQLSAKDISGAEVVSLGDHVAIRLDSSNGAKGFYYDGATWRATTTGVSYAGTGWHHFVYVMDDTNNIQKVYVDGVEKGSTAYTQSISYTGLGSNTFVGRHGNGSGNYDFAGIIDDVRVYNKALSAQEVQGLYNNVSALVATASHGFMGINNDDTYTNVTPPRTATHIYPTTVDLRSFKAEAGDDRVILTWETSRESDSAGFNIYRARRRNGTYIRINTILIDAMEDTSSGVRYRFVDQPGGGNFYYYKLESLDYTGARTVHKPAKVKGGIGR